jgi:hydrogenase/urease accessory protein HupE
VVLKIPALLAQITLGGAGAVLGGARTRRRGWTFAFFFLLVATPALRAHSIFSSSANAVVHDDRIELELTLSSLSAIRFIDGGGKLPPITPENFGDYEPMLKEKAPELFRLTVGGETLPLTSSAIKSTLDDDVIFTLNFPRPGAGPLRLIGNYVHFLVNTHVGTLVVKTPDDVVLGWSPLTIDGRILDVTLPPIGASGTTHPAPAASPSFPTFLKLGLHHILIGYDHLLFLFGLIVVCRRFATIALIVTCFTLAHSITLALAAFEIVTLSPGIIEPFIAASIVFVGVENLVLRGREPKRRWLVTFAFGLVHGFGFAGALQEVGHGLSGRELVLPLFSFNLGVELGQLAVAALCLPVLFLLRRNEKFNRYGAVFVSSVVALAGAYWLLQRTVFS